MIERQGETETKTLQAFCDVALVLNHLVQRYNAFQCGLGLEPTFSQASRNTHTDRNQAYQSANDELAGTGIDPVALTKSQPLIKEWLDTVVLSDETDDGSDSSSDESSIRSFGSCSSFHLEQSPVSAYKRPDHDRQHHCPRTDIIDTAVKVLARNEQPLPNPFRSDSIFTLLQSRNCDGDSLRATPTHHSPHASGGFVSASSTLASFLCSQHMLSPAGDDGDIVLEQVFEALDWSGQGWLNVRLVREEILKAHRLVSGQDDVALVVSSLDELSEMQERVDPSMFRRSMSCLRDMYMMWNACNKMSQGLQTAGLMVRAWIDGDPSMVFGPMVSPCWEKVMDNQLQAGWRYRMGRDARTLRHAPSAFNFTNAIFVATAYCGRILKTAVRALSVLGGKTIGDRETVKSIVAQIQPLEALCLKFLALRDKDMEPNQYHTADMLIERLSFLPAAYCARIKSSYRGFLTHSMLLRKQCWTLLLALIGIVEDLKDSVDPKLVYNRGDSRAKTTETALEQWEHQLSAHEAKIPQIAQWCKLRIKERANEIVERGRSFDTIIDGVHECCRWFRAHMLAINAFHDACWEETECFQASQQKSQAAQFDTKEWTKTAKITITKIKITVSRCPSWADPSMLELLLSFYNGNHGFNPRLVDTKLRSKSHVFEIKPALSQHIYADFTLDLKLKVCSRSIRHAFSSEGVRWNGHVPGLAEELMESPLSPVTRNVELSSDSGKFALSLDVTFMSSVVEKFKENCTHPDYEGRLLKDVEGSAIRRAYYWNKASQCPTVAIWRLPSLEQQPSTDIKNLGHVDGDESACKTTLSLAEIEKLQLICPEADAALGAFSMDLFDDDYDAASTCADTDAASVTKSAKSVTRLSSQAFVPSATFEGYSRRQSMIQGSALFV